MLAHLQQAPVVAHTKAPGSGTTRSGEDSIPMGSVDWSQACLGSVKHRLVHTTASYGVNRYLN